MTKFMNSTCLVLIIAAVFAGSLVVPSGNTFAQNSNRTQRRRSRKPVKRNAVFIGGGAQTGAVVSPQNTGATTAANVNANVDTNGGNAILGGAAGTGARVRNSNSIGPNQPNAAIGAGGAGTYVRSKSTDPNRPNAAIGAGGAGTYVKSKRRVRRRQ